MTAKEVMSDSNSHEIKATKVSKIKDRQQGDRKKIKDTIFARKSASHVQLSLKLDYLPSMKWKGPSTNHPINLYSTNNMQPKFQWPLKRTLQGSLYKSQTTSPIRLISKI